MKNEKTVDNIEGMENLVSEQDEQPLNTTDDTSSEVQDNQEDEHIDFEQKIAELEAENLKLKNEFLRAYADSENTKKRCAQEIEKNNKYAISSFAKELLSVADNLHRAIEAIPEETQKHFEEAKNLLQGVEMTEAELMKVLNKFGVQKIESLGKVFDPNFQRVIQEVEDDKKPAGTIIAELQTGYMINDRILREAMVVVTKGGK